MRKVCLLGLMFFVIIGCARVEKMVVVKEPPFNHFGQFINYELRSPDYEKFNFREVRAEEQAVRAGPGAEYEVVEIVKKGERMPYYAVYVVEKGVWSLVKTPSGKSGWFFEKLKTS